MSGYKRVNFYELCRLCAQSIQDEKTHIFTDSSNNQLQNKIKLCLSLNVTEDDFLPKVICLKCIKRLDACNAFREECLNSESMLSSYFKNFRQTEDFKKSGKVYIKDTKPAPTLPEAVSSTTLTVASLPVATPNAVNLKSHLDTQFYTVHLPQLVQNPHLVNAPPKVVKNDKLTKVTNIQSVQTTQQQLAYNINLLNATLKNSVQQIPKELLSNVLVNANGEVIKITPPAELESSILNALKAKKIDKPRKKLKEPHVSDENIVKIDLTDDNELLVDEKNKLPHIKSTNQVFNTKTYQNTLQHFNSSQNSSISTQIHATKYQNTQNFTSTSQITMSKYQSSENVLRNTQNISSTQSIPNSNQNLSNSAQSLSAPTNLNNSTSKYVSNQNNPTVILPISDFQNNFTPYIPPNTYTQDNLTNVSNNNVTNVICNASDVDSTINSQDLQSNQSYPNQNYPLPVSDIIHTQEHIQENLPNDNNPSQNSNITQSSAETQSPVKPEFVDVQKLHECEICHKRFKRREHLYQHIKLHTGFRPYKCNTCQKSFMRKEHMLRHMTLHSGIRKYECELCGKCFSRNDNLLKHKKTHNKQSSYTCEVCKKTFVMKHYYTQHVNGHCFVPNGEEANWCETGKKL